MKANEFKIKVTNKNGVSDVISLDSLIGRRDGAIYISGYDVLGDSIPKGLSVNIDDKDYELDFEYIKGEDNEN